MLAVITTFFTPAARAASRTRVVPETAPWKRGFLEVRQHISLNLGTDTTHVEDGLRVGWIGERGRDMHDDINT
jgi:hypothetical protein